MRRNLIVPTLAALVIVIGTAPSARADFIPWEYNFKPSTSKLFAGEIGVTSGVELSDELGTDAAGPSDVVATQILAFSDASAESPAIMGARGDFSLDLTLKDLDSGESAILTFGAKFSGPISSDSINLDLAFTSPETLSVMLGENTYEVTIGPYSPPGPPGSTNAGSIAAHVEVGERPTPPLSDVPEPSTLILSCVGVSFVSLAGWRSRRRQRAKVATA